MEVDKREVKIKRHEKEKSTLKSQKRIRPTSFNVTVSKFFLPEKRARRTRIPKFLLGGTISDPLNLNSLKFQVKLFLLTKILKYFHVCFCF